MLPSRVHAIVLVSKVHKPTLRALAYARATRPDALTALRSTSTTPRRAALQADWERYDIPVPLTVARVAVPGDHPAGRRLRQGASGGTSPRELVVVFVPQYVVGHWWENLLHNQSALRLRARLQFQPGVMITTVPWQLESSLGREDGAAARARARRPAARPDRGARRHAVWLSRRRADRRGAGTGAGPDRGPGGPGGVRGDGRARWRTAGTASPGTRAGSCSCGTPCPASGCVVRVTEDRHPASAAPTRSRWSRPRRTGWSGPCPHSGPGRCGGCDWQHVEPARAAAAQGGGGPRAAGPAGRAARRRCGRARSCPAGRCAGGPGRGSPSTGRARRGCAGTARTTSSSSTTARSPWSRPRAAVLGRRVAGRRRGRRRRSTRTGAVTTTRLDRRGRADARPACCGRGRRAPRSRPVGPSGGPAVGTGRSRAPVSGRCTPLRPTPSSPPSPTSPACGRGRRVLDLYAGAGLFGGALAPAVGAGGRVVCVEADPAACAAADANLADLPAGRGLAGRGGRRGAGRPAG